MIKALEILALVVGLVYIYMQIKQKPLMWYFNLITCAATVIVNAVNHTWAVMGLNVYFIIMSILGIIRWKKLKTSGDDKIYLMPLRRRTFIISGSLAVIFCTSLYLLFRNEFFQDPKPFLDAATFSLSMIASWWLTRSYLPQWLVWIASDVFGLALYASTGSWFLFALYIVYVLSSVYGFYNWKKNGTYVERPDAKTDKKSSFVGILAILAMFSIFAALLLSRPKKDAVPVYQDESKPLEERVDDALSRMTTKEKTAILHAQSKFSSAGVPRLGIPELWCTDGPHGVRPEVLWDEWDQAGWTNDSIIAYPALTCLAATWNKDMAALYGKSVGEEARYREKDVLLGPGVNIARTPLNGRNFEYMGEDPFLAGCMVVPYVQEVQRNGVAVCVKHYCLNNEESHRHTVDIDLDDRALYEIYLPAFKAAVVDGGAWSIMSSYNLYRGRHVTHHPRLLNDILKGEWGFDGAVISDWGACSSTDEAFEGGMDLEFGSWTDGLTWGKANAYDSYYFADPLLERLADGRASEEVLDDHCRRVLRLIMRTAMNSDKPFGSKCSEAHYAAARKIEGEGIVLLKNEGALPIAQEVKKIAVIGENAVKMMTVGGGSSSLKVQHEISPLNGIRTRAAADGIEVEWARGYVGSHSNSYNGVVSGQSLEDNRPASVILAEAVKLASESDLVIFVGGLNKDGYQDCEGVDRLALELPYNQGPVIEALAAANPNIVVALVSGNPVSMPWLASANAVAQVWYGGSEAGNGIADVLFGDVNPSGKLPFTFPEKLEDSPAHYQGKAFPNDGPTFYDEGIYVGYRWFENKDIKPLFPFGYGLSYTTFEYGQAKLDKRSAKANGTVTVSVPVTNTGLRAGAEVVQLYAHDVECSVDRPAKELKGFEKVYLEPGQTAVVKIPVKVADLAFFDATAHEWVVEPGKFEFLIGSSSADIRTSCTLSVR